MKMRDDIMTELDQLKLAGQRDNAPRVKLLNEMLKARNDLINNASRRSASATRATDSARTVSSAACRSTSTTCTRRSIG